MELGECRTTHSDPTSGHTAFRVGPQCFTSLPHRGYVGDYPGPACTVPGGGAVSLAPEYHQTWLRDSVHLASSQVQGHSVHLSVEQGCPCLACRSHGPTGEGRDRAGPSSQDEVRVLQPLLHRTQERRWVTTNLGPARSEPGSSQAPVQNVDAETHLSMHPSLRLVCSDRPERRLLPRLGAQSPQPVGASGQLGKEQTLPYAEDLFSRHEVGLGQPHSRSLKGACSVNAEMPGVFPAQEGGSTETLSEAPGAYGIRSRCHAARIASYETASALASRPGPEMGMVPRHVPGLSHPVLPPHLQPMVGPCFSSGRSSPRESIQACCCLNRCLYNGLGGNVQLACSCGALDRAPSAVAYQLPRVTALCLLRRTAEGKSCLQKKTRPLDSGGYSLGLSGPVLGVRAHSTRGVASSWALARRASIADICKAAGWATPNTFARFYNLRIEPVSSRVLVSDGQ